MVTDGMMDEWIEQQMDGPMDGPMDVQCFSLTQMLYHMMIFQEICQFLQKHYGSTDRRTNRWMDIRSYRYAIAASENLYFLD